MTSSDQTARANRRRWGSAPPGAAPTGWQPPRA